MSNEAIIPTPHPLFVYGIEGVALELLPAKLVMSNSIVVTHCVFIFLVFKAVFFDEDNTYCSVLYAVIFCLLFDVVYTGVLGVYMFSYTVSVYVIYGLKKMIHANIYGTLLLGFTGVIFADLLINLIYTV